MKIQIITIREIHDDDYYDYIENLRQSGVVTIDPDKFLKEGKHVVASEDENPDSGNKTKAITVYEIIK